MLCHACTCFDAGIVRTLLQAAKDPGADWLTLELRSDRAHQTLLRNYFASASAAAAAAAPDPTPHSFPVPAVSVVSEQQTTEKGKKAKRERKHQQQQWRWEEKQKPQGKAGQYQQEEGTVSRRSNLCVLCGDAMQVIPRHIASDCVDYVFVNHPEPPQQTGATDESQSRHLLSEVSSNISLLELRFLPYFLALYQF